jgi:hypothetical protein
MTKRKHFYGEMNPKQMEKSIDWFYTWLNAARKAEDENMRLCVFSVPINSAPGAFPLFVEDIEQLIQYKINATI